MHLDEGTIHAWLDGALDADEAARVEQHAAECAECAAAVAEARGLVAGASRILTALDGVPGGVVPKTTAWGGAPSAKRTRSLWTSLHLTPARAAAAAVIVLAAGTALVVHNAPNAARSAIKLANLPVDSAVILQPAAPMVVPHVAPDAATSQTSAPARDEPMAARVATKKPEPRPVPAPSRRTIVGQGGEGRAEGLAVAERAKAADVAQVAVSSSSNSVRTADSLGTQKAMARGAAADNAVRGAVAGAAARPAAAPPPAAAQEYGPIQGALDARLVAGCYVVTTDSATMLPQRLWLDSTLLARPAMLRRAEVAADAAVLEHRGVSEIVNDTRRQVAGAFWAPRRDGSIRLSLPANALNVDLLPASTSTFVGAASMGGRTVSVTLRRAECGP